MVSILIVSHSQAVAQSIKELVSEMKSEDFNLTAIGGIENGIHFGSDPIEIMNQILTIDAGDGVMIIADMGSSIMNAQMAISLLPKNIQTKTKITKTPFFEACLQAVVMNQPTIKLIQMDQDLDSLIGQVKF